MNPILPDSRARSVCLQMIRSFDETGFIDYDGDRTVPSSLLLKPGCGHMFGVLVTYEGTIIKAFSGALNGKWTIPGFAGPAFDEKQYHAVLDRYTPALDELTRRIGSGETLLRRERESLSAEAMAELKKTYLFFCFDGKTRRLDEIFPDAPSGTGDCCAPKLLSKAYETGQRPAYLAEFFYGSGAHPHCSFHAPCDSRCRPILKHIIGLDIVYRDDDIVVIDKPAGLLSIPGIGPEKADCAATRVRRFFSHCIAQPCIHRLDQDTSGLMVLGLTDRAHNALSIDFENRRVTKEYVALVEGILREPEGTVNLPIRPDPENRPRQIVDPDRGRPAVTHWKTIRVEKHPGGPQTRLLIKLETGRTHQIRVHMSAGLGHPVVGDRLYGHPGDRLMLHAGHLVFTHPVTGQRMEFVSEPEF